MFCKGACIT
jgi:hypothetical protein